MSEEIKVGDYVINKITSERARITEKWKSFLVPGSGVYNLDNGTALSGETLLREWTLDVGFTNTQLIIYPKVWTCIDFGAGSSWQEAAVAVAETRERAAELLNLEFRRRGLRRKVDPETLILLDVTKENWVILSEG